MELRQIALRKIIRLRTRRVKLRLARLFCFSLCTLCGGVVARLCEGRYKNSVSFFVLLSLFLSLVTFSYTPVQHARGTTPNWKHPQEGEILSGSFHSPRAIRRIHFRWQIKGGRNSTSVKNCLESRGKRFLARTKSATQRIPPSPHSYVSY